MTKEFTDLGIPMTLEICEPSSTLYIPTVLSVNEATINFQHFDSLMDRGQDILLMIVDTSWQIRSSICISQLVIINANWSCYPSWISLTPIFTEMQPLRMHASLDYINHIIISYMNAILPSKPEALNDQNLNAYISKFLQINDFKSIENGKALLELIKNNSDHAKVKTAVRRIVSLFACKEPAARVCSLQFLKEAVQTGSFYVVESLQKSIISQFAEIIEYRSNIRSLQRGTTFFIKDIDKNMEDEPFTNLMKLSSTFFRMVHECLYVWGAIYFPASLFDKLRLKMERKTSFPQFPREFKFFSQTKINNFKTNCQVLIKRMQERVLLNLQTNSVLSKKSKSRNGESIESPRIKQKIQPKPNNKDPQLKVQGEGFYQKQKQSKQPQNPSHANLGGKKKKKGKRPEKLFVDIRQQKQANQAGVIQNNSSKLRKKNSFNEMPIGLMGLKDSSKQLELSQGSPRLLGKHSMPQIQDKISQREQSEGGRFSIQQSISKQSESKTQIHNDQMKKQPQILKLKQPIVPQKNFQRFPQSLQSVPLKQGKQLQKAQNIQSQKSFKIAENSKQLVQKRQIKLLSEGNKKLQQKEKKSLSNKKSDLSKRKKFASSQQQNVQQIKQKTPPKQKAINVSNNSGQGQNRQNSKPSIESQNMHMSPKEQVFMKPNPNNKALSDLPIKPAKPVKLKSNKNLKTVFQTSTYQMVEHQPKDAVAKPKKNPVNPKYIPPKPQQQLKTLNSKQKESIFELAQIDTIQTINQIPSIPCVSLQAEQDIPIEQQSFQEQENRASCQVHSAEQQPVVEVQEESFNTQIQPNKQKHNIPAKIITHNQPKPLLIEKQDKPVFIPKKNTQPQLQIQMPQVPVTKPAAVQTFTKSQSTEKIVSIAKQQLTAPSLARNKTGESWRFRQFKQINLFIEPKSLIDKPQYVAERVIQKSKHDEQLKSILKSQIQQEFIKFKSLILEQHSYSLNPTIIDNKKDSQQEFGVQFGTQTRLRHKSKTNFERKGKYIKFSESQRQQNSFDSNIPQVISKIKDEGDKRKILNNLQPKIVVKVEQKQQLKPNTLLNALFKRKSIQIQ